MIVTPQEAVEALGISIELAEARLSGINQDAELAAAKEMYAWSIWDKQSPINSCSAEDALASLPCVPDAVYLITNTVTGLVETFQPHAPYVPGLLPMTPDVAAAYAAEHAQQIALQEARARILRLIRGGDESSAVS